jgi:predicted lipid-binding transport protein (Tim44 family)
MTLVGLAAILLIGTLFGQMAMGFGQAVAGCFSSRSSMPVSRCFCHHSPPDCWTDDGG